MSNERQLGMHDDLQIFSWIFKRSQKIFNAGQCSQRCQQLILRMVQIVCDLMTSDEHDILFLLEMGLKIFLSHTIKWNSGPRYCQTIDMHICRILTNIVASNN